MKRKNIDVTFSLSVSQTQVICRAVSVMLQGTKTLRFHLFCNLDV